MNMTPYAKLLAGFLLFLVSSCLSGPAKITDAASAEELIQFAQNAMDKDRYKQAIQYYNAVIDRFPYNLEAVYGAEYSIAFIHYKQKNYELAAEEFNAILAKYNAGGGKALPKKYQVLSNIVLERIVERQNEKRHKKQKSEADW